MSTFWCSLPPGGKRQTWTRSPNLCWTHGQLLGTQVRAAAGEQDDTGEQPRAPDPVFGALRCAARGVPGRVHPRRECTNTELGRTLMYFSYTWETNWWVLSTVVERQEVWRSSDQLSQRRSVTGPTPFSRPKWPQQAQIRRVGLRSGAQDYLVVRHGGEGSGDPQRWESKGSRAASARLGWTCVSARGRRWAVSRSTSIAGL